MTKTSADMDTPKNDLEEMIELLQITDTQKRFLRSRWHDQVKWMETKARQTQIRYYALRMTAIVGGVIVPALVGLNFSDAWNETVRAAAFVLGLLVAISVAVEEFFHYGERWRHYRSTVEMLKSEGWQFFQLSGRYSEYDRHKDAYRKFADHVEQIIGAEVSKFITQVSVEKRIDDGKKAADTGAVDDTQKSDANRAG